MQRMGVQSEAELQPRDSGNVEDAMNISKQEQAESLRVAAAALAREVQGLSERVAELVAAVEALEPPASGRTASPRRAAAAPTPVVEEDDSLVVSVTVAPLPELAMAAVAESTLRSLPSVRHVNGVKREGDWAEFTLGVAPGADLLEEMRATMPIPFAVTESAPEAITLALQWAWGTDSA